MKKQITRISPHQTSKIVAILYFACMLILVPIGIIMLLVGGKEKYMGLFFIIAPVLYGVVGYLMFGIAYLLYNFIAKRFGGVEFTVTEVNELNPPP